MPKRRSRSALLFCGLLLALIAAIFFLTWRTWRQERLNHDLLEAVHHSDASGIDASLRQGADPNAREITGSPSGWRDILQHLLHPVPTSRADTALMAASRRGYLTCVRRLLTAGAQVNAVNGQNETALTAAFTALSAPVMQALLAQGANPNSPSRMWMAHRLPC